jgi:hypothetical protein
MVGNFEFNGELNLAACPGRVTVVSLLNEVRGIRETTADLPLTLVGDCRNTGSTAYFRATAGDTPIAKLSIGSRGRGKFVFRLEVHNATSSAPGQCPETALATAFVIEDGVNAPVVISTQQPWSCFGNRNQYLRSRS